MAIPLIGGDILASNKQVLNVRYEDEDYYKLKVIAQAVNRSMSNLVEYWSKIHIAEYEDNNGQIIGLDDADFKLEPGDMAAHREDDYMGDLPPKSLRSIAAFQSSYINEMQESSPKKSILDRIKRKPTE